MALFPAGVPLLSKPSPHSHNLQVLPNSDLGNFHERRFFENIRDYYKPVNHQLPLYTPETLALLLSDKDPEITLAIAKFISVLLGLAF